MRFPTDITSIQSLPGGSPNIAPRSSPEMGTAKLWPSANPDGAAAPARPGSPSTPLSSDLRRTCMAKHQTGWCAQQGGQLLPIFHGEGGAEHRISTTSRSPPCSLGATPGDMGLGWVGMQSPGEALRSVLKVPSQNGCWLQGPSCGPAPLGPVWCPCCFMRTRSPGDGDTLVPEALLHGSSKPRRTEWLLPYLSKA